MMEREGRNEWQIRRLALLSQDFIRTAWDDLVPIHLSPKTFASRSIEEYEVKKDETQHLLGIRHLPCDTYTLLDPSQQEFFGLHTWPPSDESLQALLNRHDGLCQDLERFFQADT